MGDWKDILSDNEEPISEEDLLKYLEKKTSDGKNKTSLDFVDGSFEKDAIEGLQQFGAPEKVKNNVLILNKKLRAQLKLKKRGTSKTDLSNFKWIIITLLILLFICIVGYILVRMNGTNATGNRPSDFKIEKAKIN
jgi:ATP-dependent Zn protease